MIYHFDYVEAIKKVVDKGLRDAAHGWILQCAVEVL